MLHRFKTLHGRCIISPIFLREIRKLENIYSDRKQRFDSGLILGCSRRCRFGHVQVIACAPVSYASRSRSRLFPTSFWLVCPYLTKLAGRVESHSGVSDLEAYIISHGFIHDWVQYNMRHQVIRSGFLNIYARKFMMRYRPGIFRNLMRGGVGGTKYKAGEVNAKCLHLQTASFMALNYHPGSVWLKSHGLCLDCGENLCKTSYSLM